MFEFIYTKLLVLHVLSVMVAVGTVTVTDYLHLLGLRSSRFERKSLFVLPHLSNMIRFALALIYITGAMMVIAKPSILESSLFWVKLSLVILVTINGYYLHHHILPRLEKAVHTHSYPAAFTKRAAFAGSLSVVSWYAIVILAMTKTMGYTAIQFISVYIAMVIVAYVVAVTVESHRRKQQKRRRRKRKK